MEITHESCKSSSQVKKCASPPRLLLAFSQRAPSPVKVSWTAFFYQRKAWAQGTKLEAVGTVHARPWHWQVRLSKQHFHQLSHLCDLLLACYTISSLSLFLLGFPLSYGFFPFCLLFLTVCSYSVIPLLIFFSSFPFLILPASIPMSVLL